ncbi:class I SAM-dependent methyltransferase [Neolewinella lacunae]|uniref:Methyltransferase n=1 Tax=Neolewinella lacunae TaxID=1517758 RepID=A0A923T7B7_9BACT|nr:class I SAM-dependent methyltransferase [Neolewinella lacunae]MBC6994330.1 methyltransferase [Neolewinella lacunae]MDN3635823.1 class I SAM-dependent methyltransferase [Neolewinella lacunae]
METLRRHGQGVRNIVRFNWHFYLLALLGIAGGLAFGHWLGGGWTTLAWAIALVLLSTIVVSLLVSWYVYDLSGLYALDWLDGLGIPAAGIILNVHAGFDETSALLARKFPAATIQVLDFYDPAVHTEVSIRRARRAYPPYPGTVAVRSGNLPLPTASVGAVLVLLSAHEIRQPEERVLFFRELRRVAAPGAPLLVLEHRRDLANALAYTFGVFHFLAPSAWQETFRGAGLKVKHSRQLFTFLHLYQLH